MTYRKKRSARTIQNLRETVAAEKYGARLQKAEARATRDDYKSEIQDLNREIKNLNTQLERKARHIKNQNEDAERKNRKAATAEDNYKNKIQSLEEEIKDLKSQLKNNIKNSKQEMEIASSNNKKLRQDFQKQLKNDLEKAKTEFENKTKQNGQQADGRYQENKNKLNVVAVRLSKSLLTTTNLSWPEIADECGYEPDALKKIFNQQTHMNPEKYKNLQMSLNKADPKKITEDKKKNNLREWKNFLLDNVQKAQELLEENENFIDISKKLCPPHVPEQTWRTELYEAFVFYTRVSPGQWQKNKNEQLNNFFTIA